MNPLLVQLERALSVTRQYERSLVTLRATLASFDARLAALEERIQEEDFLVPIRSGEQKEDPCVVRATANNEDN